MKLTKKIFTMAICAVMAASSMVGMSTSASNNNYETSPYVEDDISPRSAQTKTLSITDYSQSRSKWCWVACAQTVLKYKHTTKTQDEIFRMAKGLADNVDVSGDDYNVTGTFAEINTALTGFGKDAMTEITTPTFKKMKDQLMYNKIVILSGYKDNATIGHDVIIYGYTYDPDNNIYELKMFDPSSATNDGGYGTLTCPRTSSTSFTWTVGNTTKTFSATKFMYGGRT